MSNFDEKVIDRLKRLEREVEKLKVRERGKFVALTTPLTSTSFDGDAFSTTGKTLIDLSTEFSVPAGVKAVYMQVSARDSGSASASPAANIGFAPNNTDTSYAMQVFLGDKANDVFDVKFGICPCDTNGDIYYQITASGTDTLDAYVYIWGYWL